MIEFWKMFRLLWKWTRVYLELISYSGGVHSLKGKRRGSLLEKDLKGEEFLIKKEKGQGVKGKFTLLLPLPRDQNREGGRVLN